MMIIMKSEISMGKDHDSVRIQIESDRMRKTLYEKGLFTIQVHRLSKNVQFEQDFYWTFDKKKLTRKSPHFDLTLINSI